MLDLKVGMIVKMAGGIMRFPPYDGLITLIEPVNFKPEPLYLLLQDVCETAVRGIPVDKEGKAIGRDSVAFHICEVLEIVKGV